MEIEDAIFEELSSINRPFGTISTVSEENKPESATVYFVYDQTLDIYFLTRKKSRKYKNIMHNPHVAFVVTCEHPPKTIQLEGVASVVTDPKEQMDHFNELVKRSSERNPVPPVAQLVDSGEMVFMKISTAWARFGKFEAMREGGKFIEANLV